MTHLIGCILLLSVSVSANTKKACTGTWCEKINGNGFVLRDSDSSSQNWKFSRHRAIKVLQMDLFFLNEECLCTWTVFITPRWHYYWPLSAPHSIVITQLCVSAGLISFLFRLLKTNPTNLRIWIMTRLLPLLKDWREPVRVRRSNVSPMRLKSFKPAPLLLYTPDTFHHNTAVITEKHTGLPHTHIHIQPSLSVWCELQTDLDSGGSANTQCNKERNDVSHLQPLHPCH